MTTVKLLKILIEGLPDDTPVGVLRDKNNLSLGIRGITGHAQPPFIDIFKNELDKDTIRFFDPDEIRKIAAREELTLMLLL